MSELFNQVPGFPSGIFLAVKHLDSMINALRHIWEQNKNVAKGNKKGVSSHEIQISNTNQITQNHYKEID